MPKAYPQIRPFNWWGWSDASKGRVGTTITRVSNDRVRPVKEVLVRIVAMLNRLVGASIR